MATEKARQRIFLPSSFLLLLDPRSEIWAGRQSEYEIQDKRSVSTTLITNTNIFLAAFLTETTVSTGRFQTVSGTHCLPQEFQEFSCR